MTANAFFWVVPALLLLFALAFALVGWHPMGTRSARWAAVGFLCGGLGAIVDTQRQYLPGWEVLASPAHWACAFCLLQSALVRRNARFPLRLLAVWTAVAVGVHIYFYFIAPSQSARIVALNTLVPILAAMALPGLFRGHRTAIDNAVAVLFTLIMLTYPARTAIFFVRQQYVQAGYTWQNSEYIIMFYLVIAALAILIALAIMLATGADLLAAQVRANRIDPLTGIGNRRALENWIEQERSGGVRFDAVLMIDLDHFKRINDVHGHAAGDEVLKRVAATLSATLDGFGNVARVGGEEFVVLVDSRHADAAASLALAARSAVAAVRLDGDLADVRPTASVGLALRGCGGDVNDLLKRADLAVYEAKSTGRDRAIRAVEQDGRVSFSKAA